MIDVIDNEDAFDSLKEEWQRLEQNPDLRIFQTFAWCRAAWKHYLSIDKRNRLWILRWHQDGKEDVVIFPFYVDAKRRLRFIMDTHSDVCDSVYMGDLNRHWAYKEASECIVANKGIQSVWLQKLHDRAEVLRYLGVFLPAPIIYKDNAFSWIESDKCDDFILAQVQMRSKDKADLKAIRRKAEKYEMLVLSAENGDVFPDDVIQYFREEMLNNTKREIAFLPNELIYFSKAMFDAKGADIVLLKENGTPVALNFILKKGGRCLSWVFLYTDSKTSTAMYVKLLTAMSKRESLVFDFGVGAYSYKIGTFRPRTSITFSLRCGFSMFEHIKCALGMNWRFAKDYLKLRIGRH